jgi:hypothetical protein
MNETVEGRAGQSDIEAGLHPTTTEKPKLDPEAIAGYEADYPDLIKDPVLARLIAVATNVEEQKMRDALDSAVRLAQGGFGADAEKNIEYAITIDSIIRKRAELVTATYNKIQQILDGKPPTSTE